MNPMLFETLWPAVIGVTTFIIFVLIIHADRIRLVPLRLPADGSPARVFFNRITGFVFMGIIPYLYLIVAKNQEALYVLTLKQPRKETLPFFFLVVTLILIITAFYSGHEDNVTNYPQIRKKTWPVSMLFLNVLTWMLYLAGYEFLFRGILIFTFLPLYNITVSVLISTTLYALAHFYKGKKEIIAAIPFGLLLGYVTARTGSIWFAFFFHLTLALSNDFFSARKQHYRIILRK